MNEKLKKEIVAFEERLRSLAIKHSYDVSHDLRILRELENLVETKNQEINKIKDYLWFAIAITNDKLIKNYLKELIEQEGDCKIFSKP